MKEALLFLKKIIRSLTPEPILILYHGTIAYAGAIFYGFPSKRLVVIGITGTKGKTTTSNYIWSVLTECGYKVGCITTANIRIGKEERMNPWHMTMPGRFAIQRLLHEMVERGVTHCVIETTSEGLKMRRNLGIYYDVAIFTNLTPEHLPSHKNSFEVYKRTKGLLFKATASHFLRKRLSVKQPHAIIFNADSEHAAYYNSFQARENISYGLHSPAKYRAFDLITNEGGTHFTVNNEEYALPVLGSFNVYNALPAIVVGELCGGIREDIQKGIQEVTLIPGRMEVISEGQPFTVVIDYAHEKASMTRVKETVDEYRQRHIGAKWIVLLGAEGGGRDKRKRKDMGEIVGEFADTVIISNTDPYDEDELSIAKEIEGNVHRVRGNSHNVFIVLDRKEGIREALRLAKPGDIVTITGNGSQSFYHRKGEKVIHDDRVVARELLKELGYHR